MKRIIVSPTVVTRVFRQLLEKSSNPYLIFVLSGADSFERAVEQLKGTHEKLPELENESMYQVLEVMLMVIVAKEVNESKMFKVFATCSEFVLPELTGTSEDLRDGRGIELARPAKVAGEIILSILDGQRDEDVGKIIRKDGVDKLE